MLQMTQLLVQYGLQSSKPVILYSMFTVKLSLLHLQYFFSMHIKLADQKFLKKSCKVLPDMSRRNTDVWCIKSAIAEFHLGFSVSGLWCDSCWISGSDISI